MNFDNEKKHILSILVSIILASLLITILTQPFTSNSFFYIVIYFLLFFSGTRYLKQEDSFKCSNTSSSLKS